MRMRTIHTTTICGKCPHGCIDVYQASFMLAGPPRVLTVEAIQVEIDRWTQKPIYQEDLTRELAGALGCIVTTTGTHGAFRTVCTAGA